MRWRRLTAGAAAAAAAGERERGPRATNTATSATGRGEASKGDKDASAELDVKRLKSAPRSRVIPRILVLSLPPFCFSYPPPASCMGFRGKEECHRLPVACASVRSAPSAAVATLLVLSSCHVCASPYSSGARSASRSPSATWRAPGGSRRVQGHGSAKNGESRCQHRGPTAGTSTEPGPPLREQPVPYCQDPLKSGPRGGARHEAQRLRAACCHLAALELPQLPPTQHQSQLSRLAHPRRGRRSARHRACPRARARARSARRAPRCAGPRSPSPCRRRSRRR